MDLSKIKQYLKDNGLEKGKITFVAKMIDELVDEELRFQREMHTSELLDIKAEARAKQLTIEKQEVEINGLQRKLATPSEAFKAQFVECAKLYLSLEECSDPFSGNPYPEYKLDIGEYK